MNTIIYDQKKYKYINYYSNQKDSNGRKFPQLKSLSKPIPNQSVFLNNLKLIENLSKLQKIPQSQKKKYNTTCKLCNKKNVFTGIYKHNNVIWKNDLIHNVTKHNTKVPIKFQNYIKRSNRIVLLQFKNLGNFNFKLTRNQLNICILQKDQWNIGIKNLDQKLNLKKNYSRWEIWLRRRLEKCMHLK